MPGSGGTPRNRHASDEENGWLTTLARERGLDSLWLGVTDEKVEGTWVCVYGTPMRYSHWDLAAKQPNNKQGLDHYVVLIVARDRTAVAVGEATLHKRPAGELVPCPTHAPRRRPRSNWANAIARRNADWPRARLVDRRNAIAARRVGGR